MTDAQLVEEARVGESDSFDLLVERHKGALFNYLCYLTHSEARADDLLQETFIRAYRSLRTLRDTERFRAWLFRIGLNTFKSHYRRWAAHRAEPLPEDWSDGAGDSPEDALEQTETQLMVRDALAKLPDDARAILVLREMEGLSYEEIAVALGISLGTVKSRIARARERLAELLGVKPACHPEGESQ